MKCAQIIKKRELSTRIRAYMDILCSGYWRVKSKRAKRLGLPRLVSKTEAKREIVQWVTQSFMHFEFVLKVALAACAEYTLSNEGSWHPSEFVLLSIEENMPPDASFRHEYWDDPPQQFPVQFHTTDPVEGCRRWYLGVSRKRNNAPCMDCGSVNKRRKKRMDTMTSAIKTLRVS